MINKWLTFKFVSSFILLVATTIWSIMYENGVNGDLWFCIWALCLVRFVDVVDEIGEEPIGCKTKCGIKKND